MIDSLNGGGITPKQRTKKEEAIPAKAAVNIIMQ